MFERFTDRARGVVVAAQDEARRLRHDHIGTEHLLLGLIDDSECLAVAALRAVGISPEAVRVRVAEAVSAGQAPPAGHIPFTPNAKQSLELSLRESLDLGHHHIGTEHLLLGLLHQGQGVAGQVLAGLGADLGQAREQVARLAGDRGRPERTLVHTLPGSSGLAGKLDEVIARLDAVAARLDSLDERVAAIEGSLGADGPSVDGEDEFLQ